MTVRTVNATCGYTVPGEFYKERPVVIYEYQKGRDHEKPLEFYRNYKGVLVTDSLEQYHLLDKNCRERQMQTVGHMQEEPLQMP